MIRHYIKIAVRNLSRQKALTAINIFGLSAGIACFSLFLLYVVHECSYDRFHQHNDRIFRVVEWWQGGERDPGGSGSICTPVAPALKRDFADVEYAVRIAGAHAYARANNEVIKTDLKFADPDFFNLFSFPLLQGNRATALQHPQQVVLTKQKALQFFGTTNVVGKTIELKTDSAFEPFTVSAVMENIPDNSSIHFDMLGSFEHIASSPMVTRSMHNWYMTIGMEAYVQVKPGSTLASDSRRLALFREKYLPDEKKEALAESKKHNTTPREASFLLQPLRDIHINPAIEGGTDPKNSWLLIIIATGVLLIACINFTTLAIGRSANRAREVGVRKVMGSQRTQLIGQFLAESVILSILSTILGVLLAYALLPFFNELANTTLSFSLTRFPEMTWLLVGLTLLVGLLAGSYPALVLSGFKPIEVLKSRVRIGGGNLFTQSLVTLQFVLSIGLIIGTIIILQQVAYLQSKNVGFNKENVVVINTEGSNAMEIYPVFKQALQTHTGITNVTAAEIGLGAGEGQMGRLYQTAMGKKSGVIEYPVDHDFLHTMGMQLVAGRSFDPALGMDTNTSVIVNEQLVQQLFGATPQEALGKQIQEVKGAKAIKTIIGVSRNFNFEALTQTVRPQLFYWPSSFDHSRIFVRVATGDPTNTLAAIQAEWKKLAPDMPFKYHFLDEQFDNFYRSEQRWSSIIGWAGGISILLACLGLFGLAALAAVNRTKEIGIRKVLGASSTQVVRLLMKHFVKLVVIALVIAAPIAWYCMNNWLQSYAYRINISVWVFVLTGVFALLTAVATVSVQAIRASWVNPVKSLTTE